MKQAQEVLPSLTGLESIQIEITTYCNLKCQECSRTKSIARGIWTNAHLSIDKYELILAKLPSAQRLILQGVGEPTLHPSFVKLCQLAKATGRYPLISFNTNGLTHNDAFWVKLSAEFDMGLSLSVDSLDPIVAERCRSGTDVGMLLSRLVLFGHVFPNLIVTLVASKLNIDDIAQTLSRIGKLGKFVVAIQNVITDDHEVALDEADEVRLHKVISDIKVADPTLTVRWETISAGLKRCVAPFLAPFVTFDGYLTPCCALVDPDEYSRVSIIDESSWESIRTHEHVTRWITRYVAESPVECNGCAFNPVRTDQTRSRVGVLRFRE